MSARKGTKRKNFTPLVFELENCELSPEACEIIEDGASNSCETTDNVKSETDNNTEQSLQNANSDIVEVLDDSFYIVSQTSEEITEVIESSPIGINDSSEDIQIIEENCSVEINAVESPDIQNLKDNRVDIKLIKDQDAEMNDISTPELLVTSCKMDSNIKNFDKKSQEDLKNSKANNSYVRAEITDNSLLKAKAEQRKDDDNVCQDDLADSFESITEYPEQVDELDETDAEPIIKISFCNNKTSIMYKSKFQTFLKIFENLTCLERDNEIHVFQCPEELPASKKKRKKSKSKKELFVVDSTPSTEYIKKPRYDSKCQVIEAPITSEDKEEKNELKSNFGSSCFNCSGNHALKDCEEPKDFNKIRINRQKKMSSINRHKLVRYHEEGLSNKLAGVLSDKLRKALGLKKNAIPEYVYRMRVMGYPPGWLEEARTSGSNLAIFFDDGVVDNGNIQPDGIDSGKIINYPGYNVRMDKSVKDEYEAFNVPKFSDDDSKEAMIRHVNNLQSQMQDNVEVCDMEIDKEEDQQPGPPGCDTELGTIKDVKERKVKEVIGTETKEAVKTDTKEVKEMNNQESGKVSPSLDDLESQKKELLEKLVDTSTNGDLNETVEADKNSGPITPRNQIIKSSMFGTPILKSASPYSQLPNSDNFSKDVSPVINFENLPNSTGCYDKMVGVLEKVRKTLKNVQESG